MSRITYLRYIVASAGALGVDMALFLAAMAMGLTPFIAAGLGYVAGIGAHWLLSSRAVFVGHVAERGRPRLQQQGLFLASAVVGLAITMGIVGLGNALALDPRLAKLAAIGISFQATYLLRRNLVFA
ncbi:MAG TPA: GtrA family protein [Allosphingosinicella sp.]|jgi:putative flippase GtrA